MSVERGPAAAGAGAARSTPTAWTASAPPIVSAPVARVLTYEELFPAEYPRLVALLTALCGDRAQAEDIAQEAMLRAHVRWDRISRYDDPAAWVRRVAINLASHGRNRRRSERRALDRLGHRRPAAQPPATAALEAEQLWATVRTLPRRQAAAVALHYLEDMSVAEVAVVLGCAEGTAKVHLHRGRAALAQMLDVQEDPT